MTAGERLKLLAGKSGTAAALLLSIGVGSTAGAALADYSGLSSAPAAQHLLYERPANYFGGIVFHPIRDAEADGWPAHVSLSSNAILFAIADANAPSSVASVYAGFAQAAYEANGFAEAPSLAAVFGHNDLAFEANGFAEFNASALLQMNATSSLDFAGDGTTKTVPRDDLLITSSSVYAHGVKNLSDEELLAAILDLV